MELPALITIIALLEFMFFALKVGLGRQKFDVPAPAVSGNEEWERYFRVQQNTMEQLTSMGTLARRKRDPFKK